MTGPEGRHVGTRLSTVLEVRGIGIDDNEADSIGPFKHRDSCLCRSGRLRAGTPGKKDIFRLQGGTACLRYQEQWRTGIECCRRDCSFAKFGIRTDTFSSDDDIGGHRTHADVAFDDEAIIIDMVDIERHTTFPAALVCASSNVHNLFHFPLALS
ncbi:MAG TPA: hypothetical protein VL202_18265 [Pararhizobium sp.]|uniref:hypothetical protein n=1 Tax=Pararhizobium sp. TaxID=1977563 RepID=UPI002C9C1E2E|nr:hypothetical protein [Pararhizobium sp.]HTO33103.1 hypothetical protein [Pararhizobium sp.]